MSDQEPTDATTLQRIRATLRLLEDANPDPRRSEAADALDAILSAAEPGELPAEAAGLRRRLAALEDTSLGTPTARQVRARATALNVAEVIMFHRPAPSAPPVATEDGELADNGPAGGTVTRVAGALAETRTARWYQTVSATRRAGAWADRERDYAALRAVLAEHEAEAAAAGERGQPSAEVAVPGLLSLVAKRARYAGAEPVYRRYRAKQHGAPIIRWAGTESAMRPAAALLAEARIVSFWPYRQGVIEVANSFGMTRAEWGAVYLRALAAWAADDRLLAAYRPAGPPPCVAEDLAVIAANQVGQPDTDCAARLTILADAVVRAVLDDPGITPLSAFSTVEDEVRALLSPSPDQLAKEVLSAIAALSDRIARADDDTSVVTPGQASQLLCMIGRLAVMLDNIVISKSAARDEDETASGLSAG